MFSLAADSGGPPLDLEISLAPESAPFYELPEGPLRATTPNLCESNRIVWASVRATGKEKIKGPELSPPLIFQARVRTADGDTLAYGPLSHTSKTAAEEAKSG